MIACKHCSTLNSLDSVFCRRCGTSLPDTEVAAAREKNEELVAEGVRLFQEGRTDEALAIAENAMASDPESVTALALKGMVEERRGRLAEALECYERIVELHPDSTLDKIKLNQLRNALASRASAASGPESRRLAWIGGLGAGLLVVGLGGAIAMLRPKAEPVAAQQPVRETPKVERFADANPNASANPPSNPEQPASNPAPDTPVQSPSQSPAAQAPAPDRATPDRSPAPILPPVGRNASLPSVGQGNVSPGFAPLDPGAEPVQVDPRPLTNPPAPASDSRTQDPDPAAARPNPAVQPTSEEPKPIMEINVRRGSAPGRSTSAGDGNAATALVRTGNAQFEVGNYAQAAATYERALRSGADPGTVNQRLGQAYERQGRRADALAAYDRSVQALENAIASGRGDTERLRNVLESVKQARRALGGG
jgi:Tfp pilus assembly protein PilF